MTPSDRPIAGQEIRWDHAEIGRLAESVELVMLPPSALNRRRTLVEAHLPILGLTPSDRPISRAKERARIYTDDAELLRRRVEDTHTRKAAVELEGLRDALKRAGYTRTPAPAVRPDSPRASVAQTVGRAWRHVRELRAERLAPAQRLAQRWTQSLRQWLNERLGVRVERTTRETQRTTAREFIAQAQREAPRQSRGIRM